MTSEPLPKAETQRFSRTRFVDRARWTKVESVRLSRKSHAQNYVNSSDLRWRCVEFAGYRQRVISGTLMSRTVAPPAHTRKTNPMTRAANREGQRMGCHALHATLNGCSSVRSTCRLAGSSPTTGMIFRVSTALQFFAAWNAASIGALIEEYERALPWRVAQLGAGQSRSEAGGDPDRQSPGAHCRYAALDAARDADASTTATNSAWATCLSPPTPSATPGRNANLASD
jgi:hypothetical protein